MLPRTLLRASAHLAGDQIVPHYLTARDEPWLRALIDEYVGFVGRKRTELHDRLREPLSTRTPKAKLRIAMLVLDALSRARATAAVPPREARAALFRAASGSLAPRIAVLDSVAASFAVTNVELEGALFADLRGEWRVGDLPADLSPLRVATDANLVIVSSFIRRAAHVRIVAWGGARALVRHARVMGLICRVSRLDSPADRVVLDVSGPFALFRHSEIYGRALASLIPRVASGDEFELTATCALGRGGAPGENPKGCQFGSLVLRSGDPIRQGPKLCGIDSRLEQKFERDFRRVAPQWDLVREPSAIVSGETLIFPDFELVPRDDPSRRWLLEIVGFWTPEYLREKLERMRAAGIERFVLCVDQNRECAEAALPPDPRIVRYKTRIDSPAVLAIISRAALNSVCAIPSV